ncbi:MAG: hypothetical protein WC782_06400 [Methylococcaceae bacterium]|jgi:Spy/CpxP family protein refolding chaperone
MNKKIFSLTMILAIPLGVNAFPGEGQGPGGHFEMLSKELNLSAEQKPKVEALFKEQREKMKTLHEDTQNQLKQLLTPEQVSKLEDLKKQHRQHFKDKFGKNAADPLDAAEPAIAK